MKKFSIIGITLFLFASLGANAETRYFFDGVVGNANQKNSVEGFDTISGSDSSRGFRTGFYLGDAWGLEFMHMDYGSADDSYIDSFGDQISNTLDTSVNGVGFQGGISLGHKITLTGRVGLAAWDMKFTETDSAFPGDIFRDKDEGVDAYVGIGLRFQIENNIRVALEYESFDYDVAVGAANTNQTLENVAVSIGVLF